MVSASALVAGQIGKPTGMLTLLLAAATTQLLDFPRITTTARRTGDGGSGVVPVIGFSSYHDNRKEDRRW